MAAHIMGCSSDDTKDTAQTDIPLQTDFDQTKGGADSLYRFMQFRDAYDLYLKLLDNKEVKADSEKQLSVLNALCKASELSGHKDVEAKWLKQLLDLAIQTHNDFYHSEALIAMGQNIFFEGNRERGIHYVNEAINLMEKTDRADTDQLTHGYLNILASMYSEMKDFDNALKTNERNLRLTMEGTHWGQEPNQQLADRRMALAKMASVLARMGRSAAGSTKNTYFQRADSAYAAWQAVQYEGNHTRDYFIVDYMKRRGLFQEAVTIYADLIQRIRQQGDTLGEMMNTAKWGLADVFQQMGRYKQAAELYEQVLVIQDTLKSRKARYSDRQLATVYHVKEQEQKILEQEAVNTRQEAYIIIILLVLIGVAALAVVFIVKNRIIRRKNHALAQQIAEALRYKEKNRLLSQLAPDPSSPNSMTDEQLYQYIADTVIREHLFRNPKFGREDIMERFQLSKDRVGTIFSKAGGHSKISTYILKLRLDYAAQQLMEQPDKTVVQIASDSGFSSSAYFSNCFRQHFGLTPTDYRREAM
ncbi:MAG: helix-turn-helix domain-containing protein [Prevotella sp.]|nr:helix-turn-helix domain-containing protein [Prevotella sp.]